MMFPPFLITAKSAPVSLLFQKNQFRAMVARDSALARELANDQPKKPEEMQKALQK